MSEWLKRSAYPALVLGILCTLWAYAEASYQADAFNGRGMPCLQPSLYTRALMAQWRADAEAEEAKNADSLAKPSANDEDVNSAFFVIGDEAEPVE